MSNVYVCICMFVGLWCLQRQQRVCLCTSNPVTRYVLYVSQQKRMSKERMFSLFLHLCVFLGDFFQLGLRLLCRFLCFLQLLVLLTHLFILSGHLEQRFDLRNRKTCRLMIIHFHFPFRRFAHIQIHVKIISSNFKPQIKMDFKVQFNSIQFNVYSAKTIALSPGVSVPLWYAMMEKRHK